MPAKNGSFKFQQKHKKISTFRQLSPSLHYFVYFNRRNFRDFRDFREWWSHSRKFISQNFSKMAIRESLSRKKFPKFSPIFFFFFTKIKNNDGKRCFLYIRTKFIKIEEKKKVVNIVKNHKFKYRNFFLYGNFKNYCKENKPFAKFYFTKKFPKWSFVKVYLVKVYLAKVYLAKFFQNGHSRKFILRNCKNSGWNLAKVYLAKVSLTKVSPTKVVWNVALRHNQVWQCNSIATIKFALTSLN